MTLESKFEVLRSIHNPPYLRM